MRPRKRIGSRRCTECGDWFSPDPRAASTQETCCAECRKAKRNRQARDRRAKAPEEFREAERTRQARCRAKKKALQEGTGPPKTQRLPLEIGERLEDVLALALASPPPSRVALGDALHELVRVALAEESA